jgi:DNA-binding LytR/AlgR family response regulator
MIHIAICDDSIVDRKILERILVAMFRVHNLEITVDHFSSGEEFLTVPDGDARISDCLKMP